MGLVMVVVGVVKVSAYLFIISFNLTTLSGRPHPGDKKRAGASKVICQPLVSLMGALEVNTTAILVL